MDNKLYMTLEQVQDVLVAMQQQERRPSTPRPQVPCELKLSCFSEYINVQWPRNLNGGSHNPSTSNSGSSISGSGGGGGGCHDMRKSSMGDQTAFRGGIGPGLNEDEKLRSFVENPVDVSFFCVFF